MRPLTRLVAWLALTGASLGAAATAGGSASAGTPANDGTPATAGTPTTAGTAAPASPAAPGAIAHLSHGRFKDIAIYSPAGAPQSVVLLLSGEHGWDPSVGALAEALARHGALVAGIDFPKLAANFAADGADCVFPDGDLENLSHFLQAYYHLPSYLSPFLVGYGSGAALAYAALVQAPANTFAGALSAGFCPATSWRKPLCKGSGIEFERAADGAGLKFLAAKKLENPWLALQGELDSVCTPGAVRDFAAHIPGAGFATLPRTGHDLAASSHWQAPFLAAFDTLVARSAARRPPPAPLALGDLPVIEIAAQPGAKPTDSFAILMSGDGGWAGLDKDVAQALSAHGIPVIGLDSLRYFWTPRTPDGLAADTDRLIRYYLEHLGKTRVLLIGYSQGADVMPFAVNRLPPATRARIALVALMAMSEHAVFEFHVTSWVSDDNSGLDTLPEVGHITGMPVLCIYGDGDHEAACPKLDSSKVRIMKLEGGHHFGGDYAALARAILASANP